MTKLEKIIDHYLTQCWPEVEKEIEWFTEPESFDDQIDLACSSMLRSGRKNMHQASIPPASLISCAGAIKKVKSDLEKCKNFDELHDLIASTISNVQPKKPRRIGHLTIYDIALRIGWNLKKSPDVVYLHAGTQIGAKALIPKLTGPTLNIEGLPSAFKKLTPSQAEDVLCRYADDFANPRPFNAAESLGGCGKKRLRRKGRC